MKAIRVKHPLHLEICEIPKPEQPGAEDVLIKVKAAGICGTDVHIYHGTRPTTEYPKIIGHEVAGEIVHVGSKVTRLHIGDHVAVDPVINCGACYACSIGRPNICAAVKCLGVHVDGAFTEYLVQPQQKVYQFSPDLAWEALAVAEPFSVAAEIAWRGQIRPNEHMLIMGAGPIGLAVLQVAQNLGARCVVSDILDARLKLAQNMGAARVVNSTAESVFDVVQQETDGVGMHVVIEAVGAPKLFEEAVKIASPAGRVVIVGFTKQPAQIGEFEITTKELDIRGSRMNAGKFPDVVNWFNARSVQPEKLVTHVFPFTEIARAFKFIEEQPGETCKVILTFD